MSLRKSEKPHIAKIKGGGWRVCHNYQERRPIGPDWPTEEAAWRSARYLAVIRTERAVGRPHAA